MPAFFDLPLLAGSTDAKLLRVVGFDPPDFVPNEFDGTLDAALNPHFQSSTNYHGPANWWMPEFDDSTWSTPVLANTSPVYQPIVEIDMNRVFGSAAPVVMHPVPGDPVWVSATEDDPDAIVLVRWWLDVPDLPFIDYRILGYPGPGPYTYQTGSTFFLQQSVRSDAFLVAYNGSTGFGPWFNGAIADRLLPGRHLAALVIPAYYRGSTGARTRTSFPTHAGDLTNWIKLCYVLVLEGAAPGRGHARAQIIG